MKYNLIINFDQGVPDLGPSRLLHGPILVRQGREVQIR